MTETYTYEYWYNKYGIGSFVIGEQTITINDRRVNFYSDNIRTTIHKIDGPAIIKKNGDITWVFKDRYMADYTPDNDVWYGPLYYWAVEQGIDLRNLSDEDVALIKMVWA